MRGVRKGEGMIKNGLLVHYHNFIMPNNGSTVQQDVDEANVAHALNCLKSGNWGKDFVMSMMNSGLTFGDACAYLRTARRR